jgi:hypothetical protein
MNRSQLLCFILVTMSQTSLSYTLIYEGESVDRTQMNTKHKTSDIRKRPNHKFLDISSTSIDALVPSLYPCVENRRIDVSATFARVRASSVTYFRPFLREFFNPVVSRFTWQTLPTVERKHFFMNILCIESFWPQKTHNITLLFGSTLFKHGRHAHARLISIRSWSWIALLPGVTHRRPITSTTVVLLPLVICLLTLPRNFNTIY